MNLNKWINKPNEILVKDDIISFKVLPKTDFWQITHYGFSRTDGNCFVCETTSDFEFDVKVKMNYIEEFDQAGVIIFVDEDNFAKLCVENQKKTKNKLGSVVTKDKRSDWATQAFEEATDIYYRVSKREVNYLFEWSLDGVSYEQIRLFDMPKERLVNIGIFGASPLGEGFIAEFSDISFSENKWVLDLDDLPDFLK